MDSNSFSLSFSLAGRRIFSIPLEVEHHNAFRNHSVAEILSAVQAPTEELKTPSIFWSAEIGEASLESEFVRCGDTMVLVLQRHPRYLTRFEGSFDELLQRLSSRRRSTLKRKVRKFVKAGDSDEADWRVYRSVEELEDFLELARPVAEQSYQARLFDGALPDTEEFKQEVLRLASAGQCRGYLLFLYQRPVAYLYTPVVDDAYEFQFLGYDESLSSMSPGVVLQYLVHELLFDEKEVSYFDFTAGEGAHKATFANERMECCDLLCVKSSLRYWCLFRSFLAWNTVVDTLRELADRLEIAGKLRRLVRR